VIIVADCLGLDLAHTVVFDFARFLFKTDAQNCQGQVVKLRRNDLPLDFLL